MGTAPDFDLAVLRIEAPPSKLPPIIALPSTAGTGSEVGRSAVISDDETRVLTWDDRGQAKLWHTEQIATAQRLEHGTAIVGATIRFNARGRTRTECSPCGSSAISPSMWMRVG